MRYRGLSVPSRDLEDPAETLSSRISQANPREYKIQSRIEDLTKMTFIRSKLSVYELYCFSVLIPYFAFFIRLYAFDYLAAFLDGVTENF